MHAAEQVEARGPPEGHLPVSKDDSAHSTVPSSVKVEAPGNGQVKDPDVRVRYAILDVPPWYETVLLGFQHYLTMLGSTVLIPFLIVPAMGGTPVDLAHVIGTIFFISGVITLLQTFVGDRLPIIQGGSFAYLTPAFAIIAQVQARGDWGPGENHERFLVTMRELQGGIIGSALIILFIGASGILGLILQFISPITVAANIGIVGLALYNVGFNGVGACVQLGLPMIFFIVLFSQYLRNVAIPLGRGHKMLAFQLFPVLLAILVTWIYAIIVTEAGAYDNSSAATQAACRTDQSDVLRLSPWFRFPYPGQWGAPTFSWAGVLTMLAGALSAMVESLGDYYAAARISGAPVPPPGVIERAVTLQGFSCVLTGLWGTGNGTTAYNENIGAMQITGVGSRVVVQAGAAIAIVVSLIGKFGGLFASMPQAMVSGLFCVMFGLIAAVGISQIQHTDMNSPRNIFVLGFGLYMGLSIPYYFTTYTTTNGHGPVNTGSAEFNDIANSIFTTAAAVALIITMFLDNTIPGTREERGLHVWGQLNEHGSAWWEDETLHKVYGLPFGMTRKYQALVKPYKDAVKRFFHKLTPHRSARTV
ncbi:hypothetical protein WJX72_004442 [[Myrmecia] bisecta]|uniref:Uncharacterized protein n=1 Tax=[Myrmecia] bisecta TaxID=41462 RepID=A0AAW1R6D5_9CHLO